MGMLFISHSSQDNDQAIKVRDWLRSNGWGEVFLDLDPVHGLAPGQRWQEELKRAGENCAAVVVLVSPNWVASRWCQTEFLVADQLGKRIFPVSIAPTSFDDLPLELKAKFQLADISAPDKEAEGFQRLAMGLKRAGLDPKSFDWPPPGEPARSVYRGLQALDVQDAAVFFGRNAHITQGLDELRRMRDGAAKRMMVILGASGSGKSSFLRAGLIARLKRDEENFLVLPIVRPERAVMTGAQGLNASLSAALRRQVTLYSCQDLVQAFMEARTPTMERLQRHAGAAREIHEAKPPTIIIPLDQAEELFGPENSERSAFFEIVSKSIAQDGNALIVATIRSDSYELLQADDRLSSAQQLLFSLPPIAIGSFQEVIEGPARLAKPALIMEPELSQQLLADLSASDALPLLAFTLERLQRLYGGAGQLRAEDYRDKLGGLGGAIKSAIDAALGTQPNKDMHSIARRLFIPSLVQVDDSGVKRRLARRAELPDEASKLVDALIAQGILISDSDSIEVSHEAVFRHWPALASWIAEERGALATLDGVRAATREWCDRLNDAVNADDWLVHTGDRLVTAEAIARRPDFSDALDVGQRRYLTECRAAEQRSIARSRRLRQSAVFGVVATGVILLTAIGVVSRIINVQLSGASAQVANLAMQASDEGNFDAAARYALTGLSLSSFPLLGVPGLENELELRRALGGPMLSEHHVSEDPIAAIDYDDTRSLVVAAWAEQAVVWRLPSWQVVRTLPTESQAGGAAFAPGGREVVTASMDGVIRIWSLETQAAPVALTAPDACRGFSSVAMSGDGRVLAAACRGPAEGTNTVAVVWRQERGSGAWGAREALVASGGPARSIDVSADGMRIAVTRYYADAERRTGSRIEIWRTTPDAPWTRTAQFTPSTANGEMRSGRFSVDGALIAGAAYDGSANVWRVEECERAVACAQWARVREAGQTALNVVAFSNRDGVFLMAGREGVADLVSLGADSGAPVLTSYLNADAGPITDGVFGATSDTLVTATANGRIQVWGVQRAEIGALAPSETSLEFVEFGGLGEEVLTAGSMSDGRSRLVSNSIRGGVAHIEETIAGPFGDQITGAECSDDCRVAVVVMASGSAMILAKGSDGRWREEDWAGASESGWSGVVAISRDNSRLAIWSVRERAIHVLERSAGVWNLRARLPQVLRTDALRFGRDNDTLVAAASDGSARVMTISSGEEEQVLRGHRGQISAIAISPAGDVMATASLDNTIRLWRLERGDWQDLGALRGHQNAVTVLAFDSAGDRLVSGAQDQTIRLWDVSSRRELWRASVADEVLDLRIARDNSALIGVTRTGWLRVRLPASLSMDRQSLLASVCDSVLSAGNGRLSEVELDNAPILNGPLDADACARPGPFARLIAAVGWMNRR